MWGTGLGKSGITSVELLLRKLLLLSLDASCSRCSAHALVVAFESRAAAAARIRCLRDACKSCDGVKPLLSQLADAGGARKGPTTLKT
jgi:hypothetical protein